MTLVHEFHLLPEAADRARQRRELFDPKLFTRAGRQRPTAGAVLADELFGYIQDTLAWIPSDHVFRSGDRGFDPYGQTAVSSDGARRLASVLHSWASVFENGPEVLELTGYWESGDGGAEAGHYERIVLPRERTVASLKDVAALAEQAAGPGLWLLHIGI